jgi:hypothetical protein
MSKEAASAAKMDRTKEQCFQTTLEAFGNTIVEPALIRVFKGQPTAHAKKVYGMKFSANGTTLATCGQEGLIKVWTATNGLQCKAPIKHNFVKAVALNGDAKVSARPGRGRDQAGAGRAGGASESVASPRAARACCERAPSPDVPRHKHTCARARRPRRG